MPTPSTNRNNQRYAILPTARATRNHPIRSQDLSQAKLKMKRLVTEVRRCCSSASLGAGFCGRLPTSTYSLIMARWQVYLTANQSPGHHLTSSSRSISNRLKYRRLSTRIETAVLTLTVRLISDRCFRSYIAADVRHELQAEEEYIQERPCVPIASEDVHRHRQHQTE